MVQRRTRALAEFLTSALLLPLFIGMWKFQFDHADEIDGAEPYPVSLTALSAGAVSRALGHWLSDHDVCSIRTNRRRRLLFTLRWKLQNTLIQRYASDPDAFQYNYSIGTPIGTVGYRFWYGLLHPLPGDENSHQDGPNE
ncbi:hypothetical protein [Halococcus sediminicola]|uniref:hypothetical protein n=1 Tax=Halococcus sediminicola TaxID=1264579 RepID=UPI0012AC3156|nr:hypothetical protein [Halococcus sediminicola]